jgi:hypothetical protein
MSLRKMSLGLLVTALLASPAAGQQAAARPTTPIEVASAYLDTPVRSAPATTRAAPPTPPPSHHVG